MLTSSHKNNKPEYKENKIVVAVRCRPFNEREINLGSSCCITFDANQKTITVTSPYTQNVMTGIIDKGVCSRESPSFSLDLSLNVETTCFDSPSSTHTSMLSFQPQNVSQKSNIVLKHPTITHSFTYDYAYQMHATQKEIYNDIGKPALSNSFNGYNTCIFCYGQTSSGKTYCMMGPPGLRVLGEESWGKVEGRSLLMGKGLKSANSSKNKGRSNNNKDNKNRNDLMEPPDGGYADHDVKNLFGIIPRMCKDLFDTMTKKMADSETERDKAAAEGLPQSSWPPCRRITCSLSYLEIYNETVRCLLNPQKDRLKVRQHPVTGVYVENLTEIVVSQQQRDRAEELITGGNSLRHTGSTRMNDSSSRSHAILFLTLTQKLSSYTKDASKSITEIKAKINLVDLAGSERAKSSGAVGETLKEGAQINKSLSVLGLVISGLADASKRASEKVGSDASIPTSLPGKSKSVKGRKFNESGTPFIPYRDSLLTWLLRESLGGNSKTFMLSTISPAQVNYEESLSTLRYADRAKQIITRACINETSTDKKLRELEEEVKTLREGIKKLLEEQQCMQKLHLQQQQQIIPVVTKRAMSTFDKNGAIENALYSPIVARTSNGSNSDSEKSTKAGDSFIATPNQSSLHKTQWLSSSADSHELIDRLAQAEHLIQQANLTDEQEEEVQRQKFEEVERNFHLLFNENSTTGDGNQIINSPASLLDDLNSSSDPFAITFTPFKSKPTPKVLKAPMELPYLMNLDGAGIWIVQTLSLDEITYLGTEELDVPIPGTRCVLLRGSPEFLEGVGPQHCSFMRESIEDNSVILRSSKEWKTYISGGIDGGDGDQLVTGEVKLVSGQIIKIGEAGIGFKFVEPSTSMTKTVAIKRKVADNENGQNAANVNEKSKPFMVNVINENENMLRDYNNPDYNTINNNNANSVIQSSSPRPHRFPMSRRARSASFGNGALKDVSSRDLICSKKRFGLPSHFSCGRDVDGHHMSDQIFNMDDNFYSLNSQQHSWDKYHYFTTERREECDDLQPSSMTIYAHTFLFLGCQGAGKTATRATLSQEALSVSMRGATRKWNPTGWFNALWKKSSSSYEFQDQLVNIEPTFGIETSSVSVLTFVENNNKNNNESNMKENKNNVKKKNKNNNNKEAHVLASFPSLTATNVTLPSFYGSKGDDVMINSGGEIKDRFSVSSATHSFYLPSSYHPQVNSLPIKCNMTFVELSGNPRFQTLQQLLPGGSGEQSAGRVTYVICFPLTSTVALRLARFQKTLEFIVSQGQAYEVEKERGGRRRVSRHQEIILMGTASDLSPWSHEEKVCRVRRLAMDMFEFLRSRCAGEPSWGKYDTEESDADVQQQRDFMNEQFASTAVETGRDIIAQIIGAFIVSNKTKCASFVDLTFFANKKTRAGITKENKGYTYFREDEKKDFSQKMRKKDNKLPLSSISSNFRSFPLSCPGNYLAANLINSQNNDSNNIDNNNVIHKNNVNIGTDFVATETLLTIPSSSTFTAADTIYGLPTTPITKTRDLIFWLSRHAIQRCLEDEDFPRAQVPCSVLRLAEHLTYIRENEGSWCLPVSEYKSIAKRFDSNYQFTPHLLHQHTQLLQIYGTLHHYSHHASLKRTIILDVPWIQRLLATLCCVLPLSEDASLLQLALTAETRTLGRFGTFSKEVTCYRKALPFSLTEFHNVDHWAGLSVLGVLPLRVLRALLRYVADEKGYRVWNLGPLMDVLEGYDLVMKGSKVALEVEKSGNADMINRITKQDENEKNQERKEEINNNKNMSQFKNKNDLQSNSKTSSHSFRVLHPPPPVVVESFYLMPACFSARHPVALISHLSHLLSGPTYRYHLCFVPQTFFARLTVRLSRYAKSLHLGPIRIINPSNSLMNNNNNNNNIAKTTISLHRVASCDELTTTLSTSCASASRCFSQTQFNQRDISLSLQSYHIESDGEGPPPSLPPSPPHSSGMSPSMRTQLTSSPSLSAAKSPFFMRPPKDCTFIKPPYTLPSRSISASCKHLLPSSQRKPSPSPQAQPVLALIHKKARSISQSVGSSLREATFSFAHYSKHNNNFSLNVSRDYYNQDNMHDIYNNDNNNEKMTRDCNNPDYNINRNNISKAVIPFISSPNEGGYDVVEAQHNNNNVKLSRDCNSQDNNHKNYIDDAECQYTSESEVLVANLWSSCIWLCDSTESRALIRLVQNNLFVTFHSYGDDEVFYVGVTTVVKSLLAQTPGVKYSERILCTPHEKECWEKKRVPSPPLALQQGGSSSVWVKPQNVFPFCNGNQNEGEKMKLNEENSRDCDNFVDINKNDGNEKGEDKHVNEKENKDKMGKEGHFRPVGFSLDKEIDAGKVFREIRKDLPNGTSKIILKEIESALIQMQQGRVMEDEDMGIALETQGLDKLVDALAKV